MMHTSAVARRGSLQALTGLRFFAAAAVLVCHFDQMGLILLPDALTRFLDGGRPAVSLFFVLSGFVLTYNYADRLASKDDLKAYFVARFARIYPVHLLGLGIAAVTALVALQIGKTSNLLGWYSVTHHVALVLPASFLAQLGLATAWLPSASLNQPWNGPAWSISCEAFFYALLPLILGWVSGASKRRLIAYALLGWIAQGLVIEAVTIYSPAGRSGFLISQSPIVHLYEFVLGVLTAKFFQLTSLELAKHRKAALATVFASMLAIAGLSVLQPVQPAYYLLSPLFALLILSLAVSGGSFLEHPAIILLGEASFSLYLLHVPAGNLLRLFSAPGALGPLWTILVIGLSILVFRHFEEPLRKSIRSCGIPLGHIKA